MTRIIQHGLRRTGTNLVGHLVKANFDAECDVNREGWKHGCWISEHHDWPLLITVRHPMSWLWAYWQCMHHMPMWRAIGSFRNFVLWRGFKDSHEGRCPLIYRWVFAYGYWLHVAERRESESLPTAVARFEDMVFAPEATCKALAAGLRLKPRAGGVRNIEQIVGPMKGKRTRMRVIHDLNTCSWMQHYDDEMVAVMRESIDPHVLQTYGYGWPNTW